MRATVNDKEVFLKEGELPAVTLSINSLTDPSKISGTTSTTIKVLATPEAKRVFGTEFMRDARNRADLELRMGFGGVDDYRTNVIPVEQDRDEIQCLAVGGNASWFDFFKSTKLQQFDFGLSERITAAVQVTTWTSTDSILYFPLVDYGSFGGRDDTYSVSNKWIRPGVRISETLRQVFASVGYELRLGGQLSRDGYKYVMPCTTDKARSVLGDRWNVGVSGGVDTQYGINHYGSAPTTFHNLGDPPGPGYDGFTDTLIVDGDGNFRVKFYVEFHYDVAEAITLNGKRLRAVWWDHTDGRELWGEWLPPLVTDPAGGLIHFGSLTLPVWDYYGPAYGMDGHSIAFGFQVDGTADYILDVNGTGITYYKEAVYELTENSPLVIQSAMPPWTAMELLLAWMNQFNLAVTTQGKVVNLSYEDDTMLVPGVGDYRDWTDRIDMTDAPVKAIASQPSVLSFKFKEDTGDKFLSILDRVIGPPGYGNADFDMEGYSNPDTITLPWAATDMRKTFGGCYIPRMVDENADLTAGFYEDKYSRVPRILIADGVASGTWKFGVVDQTQYPLCYFEGTTSRALPIAFGNATIHGGDPDNTLLNTRWRRRLNRMKNGSLLEADIFILDHEIQGFDHGLPTLVDDGSGPAWYYVQEITQHQFGTNDPTRCTLVQIPGKFAQLVYNDDATFPDIPIGVVHGDFNWDYADDFNNQ